jgi:pimeloyl-ACP methyl ester carboxylesterase
VGLLPLLRQPVLFINGDLDGLCDITDNRLGEPMRNACQDLSVANLPSGHWLHLERKADVIKDIHSWLITKAL